MENIMKPGFDRLDKLESLMKQGFELLKRKTRSKASLRYFRSVDASYDLFKMFQTVIRGNSSGVELLLAKEKAASSNCFAPQKPSVFLEVF